MKRRDFLGHTAKIGSMTGASLGVFGACISTAQGDWSHRGSKGYPISAFNIENLKLKSIFLEEFELGKTFVTEGGNTSGELQIIDGVLPKDLSGHVFIMGSVLPNKSRKDLSIIAGRSHMTRVDFPGNGQTPSWKNRLMHTASSTAADALEEAAAKGEVDVEDGFENYNLLQYSNKLGVVDNGNTAFSKVGNLPVATYDAGRAWIFDPVELRHVAPVGSLMNHRDNLPNFIGTADELLNGEKVFPPVLTTAHPSRDENTGEFFSLNYGGTLNFGGLLKSLAKVIASPYCNIMHWDADLNHHSWNVRIPWRRKKNIQINQLVHQTAITDHHFVFADSPFNIESELLVGAKYRERQQSHSTTLWVVPRSKLDRNKKWVTGIPIELPAGFQHFHIGNSPEDSGPDKVTIYALDTRQDPSIVLPENDPNAGMITAAYDTGRFTKYEIKVNALTNTARLAERKFIDNPELAVHLSLSSEVGYGTNTTDTDSIHLLSLGFNPDFQSKAVEKLYRKIPNRRENLKQLKKQYPKGIPPALWTVNKRTMQIEEAFQFPKGVLPLSPQLVPSSSRSGNGSGYLVVTVHKEQDEFWIFENGNLAQGPVARLGHPQLDLGFTLHTSYERSIAPLNLTVGQERNMTDPVEEVLQGLIRSDVSTEVQKVIVNAIRKFKL